MGRFEDIPKERLSCSAWRPATKKAEQLALEALKSGSNQVHQIAIYVDVLWRCGKGESSRRVRAPAFSGQRSDLEMPVFQRLKPTPQNSRGRRIGAFRRPRGRTWAGGIWRDLGPFRWQPSPALEWQLTSADGGQSLLDYRRKPVVLIFYSGLDAFIASSN